jgi:hypothetical protein
MRTTTASLIADAPAPVRVTESGRDVLQMQSQDAANCAIGADLGQGRVASR